MVLTDQVTSLFAVATVTKHTAAHVRAERVDAVGVGMATSFAKALVYICKENIE